MRRLTVQPMADSVLAILRATREILRSPYAWTKGRTRTMWGDYCDPCSPDAAQFDLGGAIIRARTELGLSTFDGCAAQNAIESWIGGNFVRWNDARDTDHTLIFETLDALCFRLAERERKAAAAARTHNAAQTQPGITP